MRDPRHGRHPGLFIERFEDGGRRSLRKGAWRETEVHEEILRVRGQDAPERVTIHRTCHGPVICGDPAGGGAITLASPLLSGGEHSFDCLPRMLRAGTATELYEATRGWSLIDHDLVAADPTATSATASARACLAERCRGARAGRLSQGRTRYTGEGPNGPPRATHLVLVRSSLPRACSAAGSRAAENGSDVASKLGGFGARIARREWSKEVRASPAGGE
nr:penicillin acylase family protein [Salipiger thiooxidans]